MSKRSSSKERGSQGTLEGAASWLVGTTVHTFVGSHRYMNSFSFMVCTFSKCRGCYCKSVLAQQVPIHRGAEHWRDPCPLLIISKNMGWTFAKPLVKSSFKAGIRDSNKIFLPRFLVIDHSLCTFYCPGFDLHIISQMNLVGCLTCI